MPFTTRDLLVTGTPPITLKTAIRTLSFLINKLLRNATVKKLEFRNIFIKRIQNRKSNQIIEKIHFQELLTIKEFRYINLTLLQECI